jgi:hypothetical protein
MQTRTRAAVRRVLVTIAVGACAAAAALLAAGGAAAYSTGPTDFHAWTSHSDFAAGTYAGGATASGVQGGALTLRPHTASGSWTSPVYSPGFAFSELVSSWQADTPSGTWIETHLRVHVGDHWSKWYVMGTWTFDMTTIQRTSVNGQGDDDGTVYTDTYVSGDVNPDAYQLQEVLDSTGGKGARRPVVRQVGAISSDPSGLVPTASSTTMTHQIDLPVPQYSQYLHQGEYPQFDGGGEAWCSPTSTEMVVEYWHQGPSKKDLASLPPDPVFDANGHVDASVDWAALHTYDYAYEGTGNWPFNAAYASHYGLDGSVRQYDSLAPLERWIEQGVPIVVSIAWNNTDSNPLNDLDGASIDSTGGHLMVVRGFTADGDVIANDPASPSDATVRHVYKRAQFEYDWLHASDGTVYVIKPYRIAG